MDEYFDKALESLKKEPTSISFESKVSKTISDEEAKVLFDTALESLKDPSKKFSTSIAKSIVVEKIEADAVVTRIAEKAANFISAPLFKLKKQVTISKATKEEDASLQARLSSCLIDLFVASLISLSVSIQFFEPNTAFLLLYLSILPACLMAYIFVAQIFFKKTLGEAVSNLTPSGSFLRGLSLPLFWLSPIVFLSLISDKPVQDRFFPKPLSR